MKDVYRFLSHGETVTIEIYHNGIVPEMQDAVRALKKLSKTFLKDRTLFYCEMCHVPATTPENSNNLGLKWKDIPPSLGILRIFSHIDTYLDIQE